MPRRATTKASRSTRASAVRASEVPTPVTSGYNTPLSSAYPSTYASEAEFDVDDDVSKLAIGALSLQDSPLNAPKPKKAKPFRFMDLPSELRVKIYSHFFADCGHVIDLDSDNYKRIHKKLSMLRTCRTIYEEASHVFYSTRTFRLFPTQPGRFFKTKKPLLARLNARQRGWITSLELRLGPGWNAPPRGWVVNPALGLADCVNVRRLTVFVECDPSDGVFKGFRRANGFYEEFSKGLLTDVLMGLPLLDRVHLDAWPSVKKSGAMMRGLIEVVSTQERIVCWGPERGWTDQEEEEVILFPSTAGIMSGMAIGVAVVA